MKQIDKNALLDWEKYKEAIYRSTPVDTSMSYAEREKHRLYLEAHPIEWIKFFFPGYAKYEFADFQKRAIRRILAHDEWYEVLSWSRELAKSTITMFIVLYLALTDKKHNILLTSNSKDNAVRLLAPYRANLEANARIEAYYGKQPSLGNWTEDEFITRGSTFSAGSGSATIQQKRSAPRHCSLHFYSTILHFPENLVKNRKNEPPKPYESHTFYSGLESHDEIRNRNLTDQQGGEALPPLGFRCKYTNSFSKMEQEIKKQAKMAVHAPELDGNRKIS